MEELSGAENAILGTIAGGIEVLIDQPQLYWKNATQQRLPFTLDPRLLYRGLIASITNMAVLTGIQFFGAGMVKKMITGGDDGYVLSNFEIIYSAFLGGSLSGLACGPLELTMIQQQRFGGNVLLTPVRIIKTFGIYNGIGRGLLMATLRESVFTAGYLGIAPLLEVVILDKCRNDTGGYIANEYLLKFSAAMIGALPAATLSHPLDTIKTCIQGDLEKKTYTTVTQTGKTIWEQGGITRMFSGFGWRYFRMGCAVFIINRSKEFLAPILYPKYFDDNKSDSTKDIL